MFRVNKVWSEQGHIIYSPPDELVKAIDEDLEAYEKTEPPPNRSSFISGVISRSIKYFLTGELD